MAKELKDMNREEITDLFGEKHKELKDLIEKIKEETEFEPFIFSCIGISEKENDDNYAKSSLIVGNSFSLVNLLAGEEEFEQLSNIIIATKLKKAIMGDENDE